jgi:hypothetical protein
LLSTTPAALPSYTVTDMFTAGVTSRVPE